MAETEWRPEATLSNLPGGRRRVRDGRIWQEWKGDGDESVESVTILTTEPNDVVKPIHDRMPVVLSRNNKDRWLEAGPDERWELCQPYPEDDFDAYPIFTTVNNLENDTATVIELLGTEQSGLGELA